MSFDLDYSNTVLNSLTEDKVYLTNVGCDVVVPDSKPDVIKIISVSARADIKEISVKKDRITFLGCINYDIVYFSDSESDRIKTIVYQAPMSHQDDFFDFSDGDSVSAEVVCHKCSFSLSNSRKISLSTLVEFKVYAIHNQMIDMAATENEDYHLPCLTERINPINRIMCINDRFAVEDTIEMDEGDLRELIKVHSVVADKEYKIISNKTFVKGTLISDVIFYDEDMRINSRTHITEFSEVIETRNLTQDMITDVSLEIACVSGEIYSDSDKCDISLRAEIRVTLSAYEEISMDIVSDVYCPRCKTNVIKDRIKVYELSAIGEETITLREIVDFDKDKCDKIALVECDTKLKDKRIEKEKIRTNGVATFTLLYIGDSNSMIYSKTMDKEFESVTDAKGCMDNDKVSTRVCFGEVDIKYLPGNKAEISVPVIMEHTVLRYLEREYIKSVTIDEDCVYDKSKEASMTIHFAKDDDSLWNIAKSYHTTVEEIVKVNSLDEKIPLKTRQLLLIPKHI